MNDRLPSLLFNVNQSSYSWDTAITKYDNENSWSRPCVWSKVKVTFDLENSRSSSNPLVTFEAYSSINICLLFNQTIFGWDIAIPYLTFKIQGQCHGQGQTWWSQLKPSVQSICLLFVSWQSFFTEIQQSPYLTLKIQGQGHNENRPKSNQVIYRSGLSIQPKIKEIWKVVQCYRVNKSLLPRYWLTALSYPYAQFSPTCWPRAAFVHCWGRPQLISGIW